jgi:hypothetical protein
MSLQERGNVGVAGPALGRHLVPANEHVPAAGEDGCAVAANNPIRLPGHAQSHTQARARPQLGDIESVDTHLSGKTVAASVKSVRR